MQFEIDFNIVQNQRDYGLMFRCCGVYMRASGGAVRPSHQLYITYITIALYQTTQPPLRILAFYVSSYCKLILERSTVVSFEYKLLMFSF